ncbi:MAG: SpoIIE family protein phosphatase [Anaerolineae bacterium]|nr:SpoIIE family protein phosphatase [Anaerolineae bacterium]
MTLEQPNLSPIALTPSPPVAPGPIPVVRNAERITLVYLIVTALAFVGELYLVTQQRSWQIWVITIIGALLIAVSWTSYLLVKRGRVGAGVRLLIGASLVSVLTAPFLVAGFSLILGLGVILVVLTISLQTLSQKEANVALMMSVAVALLAGGLDLWAPPSQLIVPNFQILLATLGALLLLVYGLSTVRQFQTFPLITKLTLTFLAMSLLPLGVLAFLNVRNTRAVLIEKARQPLFAAASKTVADLDTFITDKLETVATEAQLPAFAEYLNLPAAARTGPLQAAVEATLRELSRKDKVFIVSYALLDGQGRNLLDTQPALIGQDEAARDYFQKPLETGLPYVSPVEFDPVTAGPGLGTAGLYFSGPVTDPASGEVLGVLRVRYQPAILQQLVVQNNNLVSDPSQTDLQSFAMLLDENYVRLAHGQAPELIFKSVMPLPEARVKSLQAALRLPPGEPQSLATNLPELATGLENSIFDTYFTAPLETSGTEPNLIVVKELESLPWLVIFAQPQHLFITPIEEQIRPTFFLAIIIAGLVAAVAFGLGQLLANPLVNLTEVVSRFTAGELEARIAPKSGDEIGLLAASFNTMAEQVGRLLRHLGERTRELEAEVSERERAEAELSANEKKYRALFEESKDIIFISTPDGQIVDVNPAGELLSGYSRAELLQTNVQNFYADPADRDRFSERIMENGVVSDFEIKLRRKDGAVFDCLMSATVRQAEDGTLLGFQGIIRDVTGQKQIEKERVRLSAIERELTLAQEIQQSLLPPAHPHWERLDVVCDSRPAREMGGDFYAYHAFARSTRPKQPATVLFEDSERFALAVGDISGKGMPAALLMATSLASFQSIIGQGLPPGQLLTHLDQAIEHYTGAMGQNCALIYVEIVPPTGSVAGLMRVANAGCMIPLLRRANGLIEWVDAYGIPLGMGFGSELGYPTFEVELARGDLVILTSDGVVEANNARHELFGFERLEQAVTSGPTINSQAMLDHLQTIVADFVGDIEPHDDATIVVIKI